jgi:hypothetical protein
VCVCEMVESTKLFREREREGGTERVRDSDEENDAHRDIHSSMRVYVCMYVCILYGQRYCNKDSRDVVFGNRRCNLNLQIRRPNEVVFL